MIPIFQNPPQPQETMLNAIISTVNQELRDIDSSISECYPKPGLFRRRWQV